MPREFADPYVYPGTDVLKNKAGLREEAVLRQFEYEQTASRAIELRERPIPGKFDLDHLKAVHRHLFGDVYEWAGEVRRVNIRKDALPFAPTAFIESYAKTVAAELAKENHLQGLEKSAFVDRLSHHFTEFNAIHPFREGNGRATREFIGLLARNAGYELDQTRIDNSKDEWNHAAAVGRAGNLEPLKQIFTHAVRPAKAVAFDHDKPDEAMRKHPELRSAFLTLKAAEVYAVKSIDDPAARAAFVDRTRDHVRATLHQGKDVPEPVMKARDQERER
jgi:cell filamentation protein